MDKRTELKNRIKAIDSKTLIEAIRLIGGGNVNTEKTMVRAYMLDEYEAREGEQAVEKLMSEMGM